MILLTGTGGFIGQHLLRAVEVSYPRTQVVVLSFSGQGNHPRAFLGGSSIDLANIPSLPITTVIHAGAFAPKSCGEENDWISASRNIETTSLLLRRLPATVSSFVFLSTIDVYGTSNEEITERTEVCPRSLYGHSKHYCEEMISTWSHNRRNAVQVLRLGHVYGPGEDAYQKLIPSTIRACLSGASPAIFGNGRDKRTFLYVRDCVKAILAAAELTESAGVINLVGDDPISVLDLVAKIRGATRSSLAATFLPSDAPVRDLVFDNRKTKRHLLSTLTPLDAGLAAEVEHIRRLMNQ